MVAGVDTGSHGPVPTKGSVKGGRKEGSIGGGGGGNPLVGPQLHRAQAAQHDVVRLLRELVPDGVVLGAAQQVLV